MNVTVSDSQTLPSWLSRELLQHWLEEALGPTDAHVSALSPGKSGADVLLVRAVRAGQTLRPHVLKVSNDDSLVLRERAAFKQYVESSRLTLAPRLVGAGDRWLMYEYAGDPTDVPTTLEDSYGHLDADAVATMFAHLASALAEWTARASMVPVPLTNLERMSFKDPSLEERLRTLKIREGPALAGQWEDLRRDAQAVGGSHTEVNHLSHGDLNPRNIFVSGRRPGGSLNLIDFAKTGPNFALYDFARLERELRFRLFIADAQVGQLSPDRIAAFVTAVTPSAGLAPSEAKAAAAIAAIRDAVAHSFSRSLFDHAYFQTLSYVTLRLLYEPSLPGIGASGSDETNGHAMVAACVRTLLAGISDAATGRSPKHAAAHQATRESETPHESSCRILAVSKRGALKEMAQLLVGHPSADVRFIGISTFQVLESDAFREALVSMTKAWHREQESPVRLRLYALAAGGESMRRFCHQTGEPEGRLGAKLMSLREKAAAFLKGFPLGHLTLWLHSYEALPAVRVLQAGEDFLFSPCTLGVPEPGAYHLLHATGRTDPAVRMIRNYINLLDNLSLFEEVT